MTWWKPRFPRRFFPYQSSSRAGRSTVRREYANRFRPSCVALEDRTVPSGSDLFGTATALTGNSITEFGNNAAATGEVGEVDHASVSGTLNSLWWQWTASESGNTEINTFGSSFDTVLAVYTGSTVDGLTEVASNDNVDRNGNSQTVFDAIGGTTYYIAIDGVAESTGDFVLNLGTAVPNDAFSNSTAFSGGTVLGSNVGATGEAGEPEHAGGGIPTNSVWWQWTALEDGFVFLDTVGSDFNTTLAVYTGDLAEGLVLQAENDDIAPADQFPDNPELESRVSFDAVAGTTYFIAVDGFQNLTGHVVLNSSVPPLNNPPQIGDQSFSADENSPAGTVVGTVTAIDPDEGQGLIYRIIGGDTSGAFAVGVATGRITVGNGAELDYEHSTTFTLIVEVTDSGTPALSSSATITINLNDLNEAPVLVGVGQFSLDENSAEDTEVGTITAADQDAGQTLSYSIVSGNTSDAFGIDATGRISVLDSTALNFEVTPSFTLTVLATDNGLPTLSATTTVTVNLLNINDAPVLDDGGSMSLATINQGDVSNPGTLITDILATPEDPILDEDNGALSGIAVTGADTTHGTGSSPRTMGVTWSALGAVSDSSARLLAADAQTRLRFVPASGYSGTNTNGITFRAWDRTRRHERGPRGHSVQRRVECL